MAGPTNIGWTNKTWNPVRGCERVSPGCKKCYAEILAARHSYEGGWGQKLARFVERPGGEKEARWTGVIQTIDAALTIPLGWKKPSRIFVNSMSDLFHKDVPGDFIDAVLDTIKLCHLRGLGHTFQLLTKRPDRMMKFMRHYEPLPNLWLGVSAEDQATFDERVPLLLQTPAAVHWVSLEPLLGSINLRGYGFGPDYLEGWTVEPRCCGRPDFDNGDACCGKPEAEQVRMMNRIAWGVVGAESGSDFRLMDIEAARSIIGQFRDAGVPLFVKQDNGPRPGMQGRFTAEEWAIKEYPA